MPFIEEAQLMPTNPRDAFISQSTSPNIVMQMPKLQIFALLPPNAFPCTVPPGAAVLRPPLPPPTVQNMLQRYFICPFDVVGHKHFPTMPISDVV